VPTETSTTPLSFQYGNHKSSTSFSSSFGSTNSSTNFFSHKSKQNRHEATAVVVKKKDFKLDTEEFPALGGGPSIVVPSIPIQTGAIIETNNSPITLINENNKKNSKDEDITESNVNTPKPEVKNLASVLKQKQSNMSTSIISSTATAPVKTVASVLLSNVINKTNTSTKPLNIVSSKTSSKSNDNTQKISTKETNNSSSNAKTSSNLINKKQNSTLITTTPVAIISDENSGKSNTASSKKKIKLNNNCIGSQSSLNSINTSKTTTTTTTARATINNNNNSNNNHKKK
jgi:hypothetical protein